MHIGQYNNDMLIKPTRLVSYLRINDLLVVVMPSPPWPAPERHSSIIHIIGYKYLLTEGYYLCRSKPTGKST